MKVVALKRIISLSQKDRITLLCLAVLPLILGMALLAIFYQPKYSVFPAQDLANRISAHTDSIWKGNSRIMEFSYDTDVLAVKYILKEGKQDPLVFVTINLASPEQPLDLSDYDTVSIRVKEATNKRIMLFIKTYLSGVSRPEPVHGTTLRHNQYILQLAPGCRHYRINLEDFITPPWWIETMQVNKALLPEETYEKVVTFDLQFNAEGSDYRINQVEKTVIEEIAFHRTPSFLNWMVLGFVLLYYVGLGGYFWKRKGNAQSRQYPQRRLVRISSYREEELLRIKEFIGENYCRADISTRMVGEVLGITPSRVYELIKEEYHLTFKQLINKLRIAEAKRLLKETDLLVTDIALNLGFNSVSYFNNLFKRFEGKTPSEYREEAQD